MLVSLALALEALALEVLVLALEQVLASAWAWAPGLEWELALGAALERGGARQQC